MSETNCHFKNTVVVVRHDKNIKMFVVSDQIKSASQPEECRGFVILPYTYARNLEKIAKTLDLFHVNVVHKPVKKGWLNLSRNLKTKLAKIYPPELFTTSNAKRECILVKPCALSKQEQNRRVFITCDKNSLLAKHCAQNSHKLDPNDVQWTTIFFKNVISRRIEFNA